MRLGVFLLLSSLTFSQDFHFEVASVRKMPPVDTSRGTPVFPSTGGPGTDSPERIRYQGVWLFAMIAQAYNLRADQVTVPKEVNAERYTIEATLAPGTTDAQFRIMLQNLLRERFHLTFHYEQKSRSVYVIERGSGEFKLKPHVNTVPAAAEAAAPIGAEGKDGFPVLPPNYTGVIGRPKPGHMYVAGQNVPLAKLISWFETPLGGWVIDETGLTGVYDFKVDFEWGVRPGTPEPVEPGPAVSTAVQEQLGLKLTKRTTQTQQLVVDSVNGDPGEN